MKLTVRSLRELARKYVGQGNSRLTKAELVARLWALPSKVRELIGQEIAHGADAVKGTARKVARKARQLGPAAVGRRAPAVRSAHAVSKSKKASKAGKGGASAAPARSPASPEGKSAPVIPSLSESQALASSRRAATLQAATLQAATLQAAARSGSGTEGGNDAGTGKRGAKGEGQAPTRTEPSAAKAAATPPGEGKAKTAPAPAKAARPAEAGGAEGASSGEVRERKGAAAPAGPAKPRVSARPKRRPRQSRKPQSVVEGFFVTPPSAEARKRLSTVQAPARYPEELGDLPSTYDTEGTTALARDPHTLFVFWSFQASTLRRAAAGLKRPRAVLRVLEGDAVIREEPFDLAGRSFYLHELPAGRTLRVEAYLVGEDGAAVRLGPASNPVQLPPDGPSTETTLRFLKVPQGLPLEKLREYVRDGRARLSERDTEVEYFSWERFDLPGSAEGLQEKRVRRRGGPPSEGEGAEGESSKTPGEGGGWARNESGLGRWPRPKSGRQG